MAPLSMYDMTEAANPTTPMVYLDPRQADLTTLVQYIVVGSVAVMIWDFLNTVVVDGKMIKERKITFMVVVFVVARITGLLFLLSESVLVVGSPMHCKLWAVFTCSIFIINRTCISLLFYTRVVAVFQGSIYVRMYFSCLLLVVIGGATLSLVDGTSYSLADTDSCITVFTKPQLLVITVVAEVFYDICVCVCVSYGIRRGDQNEAGQHGVLKWFLRKESYQMLAERFIQDSQLYLLITFVVKVPEVIIIVLYASGVQRATVIQVALAFPDAVLVNIMATKIYRNMRLGLPGLYPVPVKPRSPWFQLSGSSDKRMNGPPQYHSPQYPPTARQKSGSEIVVERRAESSTV